MTKWERARCWQRCLQIEAMAKNPEIAPDLVVHLI
jgi:hypothetical protein